jgi:hypothetical protein
MFMSSILGKTQQAVERCLYAGEKLINIKVRMKNLLFPMIMVVEVSSLHARPRCILPYEHDLHLDVLSGLRGRPL